MIILPIVKKQSYPSKYVIMETVMRKYSKLKKTGKTHRSVLDRNTEDINEIVQLVLLYLCDEKEYVKKEMVGKLLVKM